MIPIAELSEVWGAAMWRASWQGGLAALAVWFLVWLMPSMPARFQAWLWRLVLLKFAVVLLWPVPIAVPLLPASEMPAAESTEPMPIHWTQDVDGSAATHELPGSFTLVLMVFLAWTIVVGWQAVRIFNDYRAANRLRSACSPIENPELHSELMAACRSAGVHTPPALLESEGEGSPLLMGILRTAIVLPATTLSRLNDIERAMVIGHELAHVRRGDLFWSLVATVVRGVFFFHPLAWLSERQLRMTQELAADELSIALQKKDAVSYATLLVSIVGKLGSHSSLPTMSVGAADSIHSLKRRLFAMRFMKPASRQVVIAYGIVLGLIAGLGIVPWTLVAAQAQTKDRVEQKEVTVNGKFVSFNEGVLKMKNEAKEFEWRIAENTKVVSAIRGAEKEGASPEAFKICEPGVAISVKVKGERVTFIQLGLKTNTTPDKVREKEKEKVREKDKVGTKETVGLKPKMTWGRLVSFKDGTVTIQTNSGDLIVNKVPPSAKTMLWSIDENKYKPAGTLETLKQSKLGTLVVIQGANENITIRIGARKGQTVGTFVSFKNDRLLILGKDLGESFVKRYGNNVHFNKFREDVPVYESIDGGPYKLIVGPTSKAMANVKEGAVVTVHAEGDDNITLVQIGVPKKQ